MVAQQYGKKVPPSIHICKSLVEVMDFFGIPRNTD
jgi:hypothetical protein